MPYVTAHQPISVFSTDPCKSHVTRNTINDGNILTLSPRLLRAERRMYTGYKIPAHFFRGIARVENDFIGYVF